MKLGPRQLCPIHRKKNCCGRQTVTRQINPKHAWIEPGVKRLEDGRQRRSASAMRRLVDQKIREQDAICPICTNEMTDYREVVGAHIRCRGMGGAFRDDSPSNICAAHSLCNGEAGSRNLTEDVAALRRAA